MHTLKMILRGWFRSALSSTISLLSLAIGLLCSTILLLFAVKEFRMAKTLGNDPNIYIVEQPAEWTAESHFYAPTVDKKLMVEIVDKYPEIIEWTVIGQHLWKWQYEEEILYYGPFTVSVTKDFTKFITIPMEDGCLDSVLAHPNAVAITRAYANQIFPGENPIGKTIRGEEEDCEEENCEDIVEKRTLVVEGIIDDSFQSFLNIRAIFARSDNEVHNIPNEYDWFSALIKLSKDMTPETFLAKIAADSILAEEYRTELRLCRVSDAYFGFKKFQATGLIFKSRDKNTLIIGFSIALIVLFISVFNYLNITLIRSSRRLKNIAGQRIMGASKRAIATQIIAETALHVFVGFALALLFMPDAMQLFNSFMNSDLQLQDIIQFDNLLYVIALLGALILIPALYLITKFTIKQPMEVFKNPTGNKIQYLGSLVILQMIISVCLIAFSINVKRQMDYIANTISEGHKILFFSSNYETPLSQDFIDYMKHSSSTTEYLIDEIYPDWIYTTNDGERFIFTETEPNYFDFFRIPIVSGRVFDSIPSEIIQIVVNKEFIKQKEINGDPVGYQFSMGEDERKFRIVGVCENFCIGDATSNTPPIIYKYRRSPSKWGMSVRFSGSLEAEIKEVKEIYENFAKKDGYESAELDYIMTIADFYIKGNPEANRLRIMVTFFAGVSIFLSAMGLFGLSWYTVERRRKEIALRKVHGASTAKLLLLLVKTFFIWCAVATAIALPIGYFISQHWLERFAYKINNSITTLLITALIAAAVTFLTVIFQTIRAALSNPAKFIKME